MSSVIKDKVVMNYTSTKILPETLEAIKKLQAISTLHDLDAETIPEILHRLVTIELERASDSSEFTAMTYRISQHILDKTSDDAWISGDEFKNRQPKAAQVG